MTDIPDGLILLDANFWQDWEASGLADAVRQSLTNQAAGAEEAAAKVLAIAPQLRMTTSTAPVQIEGELPDGNWLYFRSRGAHWSLSIARNEDEIFSEGLLFYQEAAYGSDFEASWMPHGQAWAIIEICLTTYLQQGDKLDGN